MKLAILNCFTNEGDCSIRAVASCANGGMTIKSLLKSLIGWVIGVLIAVFIVSLWKKGEVDWGQFVALSIGGLIGAVILGIMKVFINGESERHN